MSDINIFTRTIYGSELQTALALGLPYEIAANTTLNEKFGIQAGAALGASDRPSIHYFAIGCGGHRSITGAEGIPYTSPINHRASDAALFKHMPFVLRRTNNDLTVTERANYALRRLESHGGLDYYAYYLKRIDLSTVTPSMEYTVTDNGVATTNPFVPTSSNLNPVATDLSNTEVITTAGNFLSVSAAVPLSFSEQDVVEFKNVATILYGSELYAIISEIAVCSGVDRTVQAQSISGNAFAFTEAVGVQIVTHVTSYYSVGFTNKGFDFTMDLGATEAMFTLNDVTSGN